MNFIFAGRITESKGIDMLLRAWELMKDTAPELIICGSGPLENWCRRYIIEHKLNVNVLGFLSNTEVKKRIADSEALILPTQWYEGFPMIIVESYSVNTPVICTDLGNAGSIVIEGITGWKFHNAEELIDCIHKAETIDLKQSVRAYYQKNYSPEVNYRILQMIYNRIK